MLLKNKIQQEYEDVVSKGVKTSETSSYAVGGEGFLTATGKNNFPLVQVFYAFVKARTSYPFTIINLGMDRYQLAWLDENTDCLIITPDKIDNDDLPTPCGSAYDPRIPYYLSLTPYHRTTCWVASDSIVLKNCVYLFVLGEAKPTAFKGFKHEIASTEFFNTFRYSSSMYPACSSIFAYNYIRDYDLIKKWLDFTKIYRTYNHMRFYVNRPGDAGLIWADIHNMVKSIIDVTTECTFVGSEVSPWPIHEASPPIFPFLDMHHSKTAIVFSKKNTPWYNWTTSWGDKILPFKPVLKFPKR
jgi:hypothetical protein